VGLPSLSALRNKSFSNQRATLTSRSAAQNAARQENQNAMAIAVTEPHARCSPQHAPNVAKAQKFLLNLAVIGQFTAAIATEKSDRADNLV